MEIEYRSFEDFLAAREKNGITSNLPNADIREDNGEIKQEGMNMTL